MPLFLLAAIGLVLFLLFLKSLSRANSQVLIDVLRWSSLTVSGIAILLFILSGRIPHATALALGLLILWLQYGRHAKPKLLESPISREEAMEILGLDTLHNKAHVLEAYDKKIKMLPKKNKKEKQLKLRHAKEKLIQLLD